MIQRLNPGTIVTGERIGRGGFGAVYEARQEPLGVPLAIKIFDPSVFNELDISLDRFFQEAEILMTLRHPNIMAVYGFGEHDGAPYILMERFTGKDLDFIVSEKGIRPSPSQVLEFVYKACDALHHAHSHPTKPVIHRDIKPANLMAKAGDMRVLDFGIAKKIMPVEKALTLEGFSIVGGAFSDPALIENPRLIDARTDIYGLGACWYYILTGTSPSGSNVAENLRQIKGMTHQYQSVVLKCLASMDSRYSTMLELKNDVASLIEHGIPSAEYENRLDEDAMLLLGTLFGMYTPEQTPQTIWFLQNTISKKLNEFRFAISLSRLRDRAFISDEEVTMEDGFTSQRGLAVTEAGKEWVKQHSTVIASFIDPPNEYDEVPF